MAPLPPQKGGQEIGLTRRGNRSKLMLVVDGRGIPLGGMVASAQKAEVQLAEPTLTTIRVPRQRGRPRCRPKELVADKGYDSNPLRQRLRRRGIHPCIPDRRGKRPRRGPKPNVSSYRYRWVGSVVSPGSTTTGGCWCDMSVGPRLPWLCPGGLHPHLSQLGFEMTSRRLAPQSHQTLDEIVAPSTLRICR